MNDDSLTFIGKTLEEIENIHPNFRIVEKDGIGYMLTCEYRYNRLNIKLKDNVVIDAYYG